MKKVYILKGLDCPPFAELGSFIFAYIILGFDVILKALKNIFKEKIFDEIKPGSSQAMDELRALGAEKLIMLTGDEENIAREIAEKLN